MLHINMPNVTYSGDLFSPVIIDLCIFFAIAEYDTCTFFALFILVRVLFIHPSLLLFNT